MRDEYRLAELCEKVTAAIIMAEDAERSGHEEQRVATYSVVSLYEEEIASLLPPDSAEGAIARRGAIRAALSAGQVARARLLGTRYLSETTPDRIRDQLTTLLGQLEAEIPDSQIRVSPSRRFKLVS